MADVKKVTPNIVAEETAPAPVKEKKVKIMIPKDPANPDDNTWFCQINGQAYYIARGKQVEVPPEVATLYEFHLEETEKVRQMVQIKEIG